MKMKPTKLSKQPKYDIKVQKQTVPKTVQFMPVIQHRVKGSRQSHGGYMNSFKKIIEGRLFSKEKTKENLLQSKSQYVTKEQTNTKVTDEPNSTDENYTTQSQINNQQTLRRQSISSVNPNPIFAKQQQKLNNTFTQINEKQLQQNQNEYLKLVNSQYLRIKYIKKLSIDNMLIGNENQVDMLQFKIQNKLPIETKRWSLNLEKPIEGVTVSKLADSKILLWTQKQLHIFQCNHKNINQQPSLIEKITVSQQSILSVQFVKRNIFLVCCRSHIQIYQITQANKSVTIKKLGLMRWKCPQQFQVVEVPEHFGSNIKIFYANMRENEDGCEDGVNVEKVRLKEKYKDNKSKEKNINKQSNQVASTSTITTRDRKKDVFGLYYVEIQYDYSKTKINQLKKVYDIKKSLRHQIKLFNISQNIFFMNLNTQVLAVKNGLIIDSVGVNFKFDHCYLKIIQNDILVHILTDKIEFYKLELNYDVMPQKINVVPFDSIYFPRQLGDELLSILPVGQGYGVFFQHQLSKSSLEKLKKANISYWYALTYPVPLYQKLIQIFPSTQQIEQTSFQTFQQLCDMSCKMGLTISESYRFLWRKSKKQTQKDYQILLLSRDYTTIQQQITLLLKKRAQKWRMINKNQQICLQFLRPRIFYINCKIQNLQQFSSCHFFNLKLKAYKDIQVQRRRFQLQMYKKGKQTSLATVNKLMEMFQVKELKAEYRDQGKQQQYELRLQSKKKQQVRFSYQQQQSEILSQGFDQSQEYYDEQQQEQMSQFLQPIKLLVPLPSQQQQINKPKQKINLFDTFLKTSKNFNQIEQDRKTAQVREKQKMRHQLQQKMKQTDYNEIKINIKDYYFFRDTGLKQYFLQIVSELMSKQHTQNDHLRYFSLRVLVRNFKILFRSLYQQLLLQMISTYKHKISRLIEHFIQLLPYQYDNGKLPTNTTDQSLCQCIWNPIQSQQIQQMLFLSDLTTIENKQIVAKFKQSLWYKRNYLAHHGVVTLSKQEVKAKYSKQNMKQMQEHYFYLFISKFLQIKVGLMKQMKQIQKANNINSTKVQFNNQQSTTTPKSTSSNNFIQAMILTANKQKKIDKKTQQNITRIQKQLTRTNQLLKRLQQIYPLMPQHLKGYLNLYFDLYNYLENFTIEQKHYSSIYEFLRLRDFQLFRIFFVIEKKSKGFLLKHILQKYQNPQLIQNGRQKFISGIQHYFDSNMSQITDLKTILNRLNGQSRQFHIKFEPLYDCLLQAMMKKIHISPSIDINLDQLLIYVHNIPFSTENGRIFQKLLLIQQVHLQMDLLKRSKINMSIMEIRDCGEVVIGALVQAELRANRLVLDDCVAKEYTANDSVFDDDNKRIIKQLGQSSVSFQQPTFRSNNNIPQKINSSLTTNLNHNNLIPKNNQQPILEGSRLLITGIMSSISKLSLTKIQSIQQLKMYFWKCISQLQCIKRHLYGNLYKHLLGFVFVTELLQQQYLIPLVGQALEDEEIKEMLELQSQNGQVEKQFKKCVVYYCYKQRLAKHNQSYLQSQTYINSLLNFLPYTDPQRMLIQEQIRYCHLFKQCQYQIPYPLTVICQIPVLDEIEYHISQIKSQKIDKLDVKGLFDSMQTMRQLVQPSLSLTQKSLGQRVKEFQRVLYQFVFFKYLREKKLTLALKMINHLLELSPQQNVMIYCVFIIDAMLGQFNDATGDLLIKLISYYYDNAQQLIILLQELITKPFTTVQFGEYVGSKIDFKIKQKKYRYFDKGNDMFTSEVRQLAKKIVDQQKLSKKSLQNLAFEKNNPLQEKFNNLCQLFDTVYHHIQKSSQYIQQNKYFQIIYRLMLFNPYQAAYFIYNKPQINLKVIRAFLAYISQQTLLFNTEIVLKIGSLLFVIILNRIRDNFMISQQIKQYEKLKLSQEMFDENQFVAKFSDKQKLTQTQKLVYQSYLAMKKKLQGLKENDINEKIQKQLCKVKQIYDKDSFLVNKHNIIAMRKLGTTPYLSYQKWFNCDSKLQYYMKNIDEFASYKEFAYLFTAIDKDQSYVIKGQQEFNCPKVTSWPNKVQFNKIKNRHNILIQGKNTRIPTVNKKENTCFVSINSKRERKPSAYLPEQFKLNKKSTTNLHKDLSIEINDQNQLTKHTQSLPVNRDSGNFLTVTSPNSNAGRIGKNQKLSTPKNSDNPILNFFNMGASFGKNMNRQ